MLHKDPEARLTCRQVFTKPAARDPQSGTSNLKPGARDMKPETQSPKAEVQKSAEARVLLFTLNPKS